MICSLLFEVEAASAAGLPEQAADALRAYESLVPDEQPLWLRNLSLRARAALAPRRTIFRVRVRLSSERSPSPIPRCRSRPPGPSSPMERCCAGCGSTPPARAALTRRRRFRAPGADAWAARATDELARVPGRRARDRTELTDAESRIVEIVVGGRSNKEVAAALFLSVKTVEVTLTRVYRKLGVRSRTELAARLAGGRERLGVPLLLAARRLRTVDGMASYLLETYAAGLGVEDVARAATRAREPPQP